MIRSNLVLMAAGPGGPPFGGQYGGIPGGPSGYGPPGYGPQGHPPGYGAAPPPGQGIPRTDTLAIVSFVAGVVGLIAACANIIMMLFGVACGACCPLCTVGSTLIGLIALIPSVLGTVFGALSMKRIKDRPDELTGKGLAIAGTIISGVSALIAVVTMVLPMLGIGCLAMNAPPPRDGGGTWSPPPDWNVPDPNAVPVDPNAVPVDPNAVPVDPNAVPVDPNAIDPNAVPVDPALPIDPIAPAPTGAPP